MSQSPDGCSQSPAVEVRHSRQSNEKKDVGLQLIFRSIKHQTTVGKKSLVSSEQRSKTQRYCLFVFYNVKIKQVILPFKKKTTYFCFVYQSIILIAANYFAIDQLID